MLKVGISGGIGSGKTTACHIFAHLGIPIYYADDRAKWLMTNKSDLIASIKNLFGSSAYLQDGQLNRQHLSRIIFTEPEKRKQLNALVHPAVWKDGEDWHLAHANAPYTLKEAALIFESGGHKLLDKVIVVTAPKELRLQRVMNRDQVDEAAVLARMAAQMPEEEKVALADFVIYNDGNKLLIPQILKIHRILKGVRSEE